MPFALRGAPALRHNDLGFMTYRQRFHQRGLSSGAPAGRRHRWAPALALLLAVAGCDETKPPTREPPPPAAKPAACSAERKVNDAANVKLFPPDAGTFCLDPSGSDKAYGEGTNNPLDGICNLFDGECEIYLSGGVKHVVEARYVDGGGSGATIDVYLSRYESTEAAYAMFTKRVVGDLDPAHEDMAKPTAGGGAAALGIGNAYLWRGAHLAEITYNDVSANTEAQIRERADKLLPALVTAFGDKLPGKPELPASAAKLPEDKRLPLGIRYLNDKLLGIEGSGGGAFGYYREGDARWRVLSVHKGDDDQARDLLKVFAKSGGAAEEKGVGDEATRFMSTPAGLPKTEWIVARKGAWIVGIGDEDRALVEGMTPEAHRKKTLDLEKKRALLKTILSAE